MSRQNKQMMKENQQPQRPSLENPLALASQYAYDKQTSSSQTGATNLAPIPANFREGIQIFSPSHAAVTSESTVDHRKNPASSESTFHNKPSLQKRSIGGGSMPTEHHHRSNFEQNHRPNHSFQPCYQPQESTNLNYGHTYQVQAPQISQNMRSQYHSFGEDMHPQNQQPFLGSFQKRTASVPPQFPSTTLHNESTLTDKMEEAKRALSNHMQSKRKSKSKGANQRFSRQNLAEFEPVQENPQGNSNNQQFPYDKASQKNLIPCQFEGTAVFTNQDDNSSRLRESKHSIAWEIQKPQREKKKSRKSSKSKSSNRGGGGSQSSRSHLSKRRMLKEKRTAQEWTVEEMAKIASQEQLRQQKSGSNLSPSDNSQMGVGLSSERIDQRRLTQNIESKSTSQQAQSRHISQASLGQKQHRYTGSHLMSYQPDLSARQNQPSERGFAVTDSLNQNQQFARKGSQQVSNFMSGFASSAVVSSPLQGTESHNYTGASEMNHSANLMMNPADQHSHNQLSHFTQNVSNPSSNMEGKRHKKAHSRKERKHQKNPSKTSKKSALERELRRQAKRNAREKTITSSQNLKDATLPSEIYKQQSGSLTPCEKQSPHVEDPRKDEENKQLRQNGLYRLAKLSSRKQFENESQKQASLIEEERKSGEIRSSSGPTHKAQKRSYQGQSISSVPNQSTRTQQPEQTRRSSNNNFLTEYKSLISKQEAAFDQKISQLREIKNHIDKSIQNQPKSLDQESINYTQNYSIREAKVLQKRRPPLPSSGNQSAQQSRQNSRNQQNNINECFAKQNAISADMKRTLKQADEDHNDSQYNLPEAEIRDDWQREANNTSKRPKSQLGLRFINYIQRNILKRVTPDSHQFSRTSGMPQCATVPKRTSDIAAQQSYTRSMFGGNSQSLKQSHPHLRSSILLDARPPRDNPRLRDHDQIKERADRWRESQRSKSPGLTGTEQKTPDDQSSSFAGAYKRHQSVDNAKVYCIRRAIGRLNTKMEFQRLSQEKLHRLEQERAMEEQRSREQQRTQYSHSQAKIVDLSHQHKDQFAALRNSNLKPEFGTSTERIQREYEVENEADCNSQNLKTDSEGIYVESNRSLPAKIVLDERNVNYGDYQNSGPSYQNTQIVTGKSPSKQAYNQSDYLDSSKPISIYVENMKRKNECRGDARIDYCDSKENDTQRSSFKLSDSQKGSVTNLNNNNSSYLPEPEMLSQSPARNGRRIVQMQGVDQKQENSQENIEPRFDDLKKQALEKANRFIQRESEPQNLGPMAVSELAQDPNLCFKLDEIRKNAAFVANYQDIYQQRVAELKQRTEKLIPFASQYASESSIERPEIKQDFQGQSKKINSSTKPINEQAEVYQSLERKSQKSLIDPQLLEQSEKVARKLRQIKNLEVKAQKTMSKITSHLTSLKSLSSPTGSVLSPTANQIAMTNNQHDQTLLSKGTSTVRPPMFMSEHSTNNGHAPPQQLNSQQRELTDQNGMSDEVMGSPAVTDTQTNLSQTHTTVPHIAKSHRIGETIMVRNQVKKTTDDLNVTRRELKNLIKIQRKHCKLVKKLKQKEAGHNRSQSSSTLFQSGQMLASHSSRTFQVEEGIDNAALYKQMQKICKQLVLIQNRLDNELEEKEKRLMNQHEQGVVVTEPSNRNSNNPYAIHSGAKMQSFAEPHFFVNQAQLGLPHFQNIYRSHQDPRSDIQSSHQNNVQSSQDQRDFPSWMPPSVEQVHSAHSQHQQINTVNSGEKHEGIPLPVSAGRITPQEAALEAIQRTDLTSGNGNTAPSNETTSTRLWATYQANQGLAQKLRQSKDFADAEMQKENEKELRFEVVQQDQDDQKTQEDEQSQAQQEFEEQDNNQYYEEEEEECHEQQNGEQYCREYGDEQDNYRQEQWQNGEQDQQQYGQEDYQEEQQFVDQNQGLNTQNFLAILSAEIERIRNESFEQVYKIQQSYQQEIQAIRNEFQQQNQGANFEKQPEERPYGLSANCDEKHHLTNSILPEHHESQTTEKAASQISSRPDTIFEELNRVKMERDLYYEKLLNMKRRIEASRSRRSEAYSISFPSVSASAGGCGGGNLGGNPSNQMISSVAYNSSQANQSQSERPTIVVDQNGGDHHQTTLHQRMTSSKTAIPMVSNKSLVQIDETEEDQQILGNIRHETTQASQKNTLEPSMKSQTKSDGSLGVNQAQNNQEGEYGQNLTEESGREKIAKQSGSLFRNQSNKSGIPQEQVTSGHFMVENNGAMQSDVRSGVSVNQLQQKSSKISISVPNENVETNAFVGTAGGIHTFQKPSNSSIPTIRQQKPLMEKNIDFQVLQEERNKNLKAMAQDLGQIRSVERTLTNSQLMTNSFQESQNMNAFKENQQQERVSYKWQKPSLRESNNSSIDAEKRSSSFTKKVPEIRHTRASRLRAAANRDLISKCADCLDHVDLSSTRGRTRKTTGVRCSCAHSLTISDHSRGARNSSHLQTRNVSANSKQFMHETHNSRNRSIKRDHSAQNKSIGSNSRNSRLGAFNQKQNSCDCCQNSQTLKTEKKLSSLNSRAAAHQYQKESYEVENEETCSCEQQSVENQYVAIDQNTSINTYKISDKNVTHTHIFNNPSSGQIFSGEIQVKRPNQRSQMLSACFGGPHNLVQQTEPVDSQFGGTQARSSKTFLANVPHNFESQSNLMTGPTISRSTLVVPFQDSSLTKKEKDIEERINRIEAFLKTNI